MTTSSASKYDTTVDLSSENDSHTLMVRLVGAQKRVLDVGCASGYLARVLVEHGCTVSGVEFDAAAAEEARPTLHQLVVGDLEQLDLLAEFGPGGFDVVVLGDVLEHLRDPLPVLKGIRPLLAPGGYVVISIPNVAHAAVRLSLLMGRFDYRPLGLLDTTHLRFFTRESLSALLRDAGLGATDFLRTTADVYATEQGLRPGDVPQEVVDMVLTDPDATTYQFLVRAVPDDGDWLVTEMRLRMEAEVAELSERLARAEADLLQARQHAENVEADRERLTGEHAREVEGLVSAGEALRAETAAERESLQARAYAAERELAELRATRLLRATSPLRNAYGRLRQG